jgi:glycosyltransferase involved in cell wall biosynthesis
MDKVSIVVPVFNEERAVREVLAELCAVMKDSDVPYELIVVDDGSTDETASRIRETGEAALVSHPENRGYGAALKSGIRRATGEEVLILDADGSYPVAELPGLLAARGDCDMVVGVRQGRLSRREPLRRLGRWILKTLANYLLGTKIPDINSGMRWFRRSAALQYFNLLPENFSFTTTLTLAMLSDGRPVKYVPIQYQCRVGRSKIRPVRDLYLFLMLIIRTVVYFNPLKVFLPMGLCLLGLGTGVLVWRVLFRSNIGQFELLCLLMGVQVGFMGLLADLFVRHIKGSGGR